MRRSAFLGAALLLVALALPSHAAAQLGPNPPDPTTPPTVPDTVPDTLPPTTEAPPPPTTPTTRRPPTTTTIPPTTTTIPDVATVPPIEPDPADTELPAPSTGGGDISPVFGLLSVAGFAAAVGILFRRWYETRPGIRDRQGQTG